MVNICVLWHRITFRLTSYSRGLAGWWRRLYWRARGLQLGRGTRLPAIACTWPHQVSLGAGCTLEPGIVFKYDGIYGPGPSICVGDNVFIGHGVEFNISQGISVGSNCLIASGCRFIDHDHGYIDLQLPMRLQPATAGRITLCADVWLGANVVVLKGVTIAQGAIVGAGAVVTVDIPAYEIWAGVPARKIGSRVAL